MNIPQLLTRIDELAINCSLEGWSRDTVNTEWSDSIMYSNNGLYYNYTIYVKQEMVSMKIGVFRMSGKSDTDTGYVMRGRLLLESDKSGVITVIRREACHGDDRDDVFTLLDKTLIIFEPVFGKMYECFDKMELRQNNQCT